MGQLNCNIHTVISQKVKHQQSFENEVKAKKTFVMLSPLASKWQLRMFSLLERNVKNVSNSSVLSIN